MEDARIEGAGAAVVGCLARIGIVVFAVLVSLAALEVAARLTLDPVDYLLPDLVADETLGHRVASGSAQHDEWGFRNRVVPASVPIVAIGDSMTYGWNARARDAWPAALTRQTGEPVYNLAMGDYGPGQYAVLLSDYATELSPERVLIGLYLGNDLIDAWKYVYVLGARPDLRKRDPDLQAGDVTYTTPTQRLADEDAITQARGWLARNSVMYRVATSSALGAAARVLESRAVARQPGTESVLVGGVFGSGITLDPVGRGAALDADDPRVAEGLRLTVRFLREMGETCEAHRIACAVVLLPTKERVYADAALRRSDLKHGVALQALVADEAAAVSTLVAALDAIHLPYVDTLPALQTTRPDGVFGTSQDIHPNAAGYGVIADEVAKAMAEWEAADASAPDAGRPAGDAPEDGVDGEGGSPP